jgi:hypothetical protein
MAVVRKTHGFLQLTAPVSGRQLSRETGIDVRSVTRALSDLVRWKILEVSGGRPGRAATYGLRLDVDSWKPGATERSRQVRERRPTGQPPRRCEGPRGSGRGAAAGQNCGAEAPSNKEETRKKWERDTSEESLSHSDLVEAVRLERPDWTEVTADAWVKRNTNRLVRVAMSRRPRDLQTATEAVAMKWASVENEPQDSMNIPSAPREIDKLPPSERRRIVLRRLAARGNQNPPERLVRLEFEQFGEFLGEYAPPGDSS